ncbi:MAG: hypothetical protein Tsb005_01400 [Gammaproteobacteria bacterium]
MNKQASNIFAVEKLMAETRRLAAEYYQATQQTLPVSNELAKYDACRLLSLKEAQQHPGTGVDAIDSENKRYQIKSRVIFQPKKSGYRIGQLNIEGEWDNVVLVLMDHTYHPFEIYQVSRESILDELSQKTNPQRSKRGAMSVAKFKALGKLVWSNAHDTDHDLPSI